MSSSSGGDGHSRRPTALISTLLAAVMVLGPAAASAEAKGNTRASKAGESLTLVVKPKEVSLTEAIADEFFVEVSGRSSKHAQLEVFLETVTKAACAANEPAEAETEGVQQENPAQLVPGHVEKYPETLDTNFTGSFDWDTNNLILEKEGGVKPGPKLICAYLTPPEAIKEIKPTAEEERIAEEHETGVEPKRVPVAPLLSARATLKVVDGNVPKSKTKSKKK